MFDFKKKTNETDDLAQLSEEDIQKKLYGTYKPGTLGNVIKVNDEEEEAVETPDVQSLEVEPDLFSDVNTLEAIKSADVSEVEDASEEIVTNEEDLIPEKKEIPQEESVDEIETVVNDEIEAIVEDEDLLQIDFNKEEDSMGFLEPVDRFASVKVTLFEMWDKLRSMGVKYFLIAGGILIGIILGFSIISSYVGDREKGEVVVVDETRAAPAVVTSIPAANAVPATKPTATRDVVAQPVALPGGALTPASSGTDGVDGAKSVIGVPKYTVQICVSNKIDATDKLVGGLKDQGFDAFYRKHTTRTGRELYFVYVGQFVTRDEANIAMKHYRTVDSLRKYNDSFVTNIK